MRRTGPEKTKTKNNAAIAEPRYQEYRQTSEWLALRTADSVCPVLSFFSPSGTFNPVSMYSIHRHGKYLKDTRFILGCSTELAPIAANTVRSAAIALSAAMRA